MNDAHTDALSDPVPPPTDTNTNTATGTVEGTSVEESTSNGPTPNGTDRVALPQGVPMPSVQEGVAVGPTTVANGEPPNDAGGAAGASAATETAQGSISSGTGTLAVSTKQKQEELAALNGQPVVLGGEEKTGSGGVFGGLFGGKREKEVERGHEKDNEKEREREKEDGRPLSQKYSRRSSINEKRALEDGGSLEKGVTKRKKYKFGRKKEQGDEEVHEEKKHDVIKHQPKPVGLFTLFRYSTRTEIVVDIIGLVLAAAAGAAQPLMTLIFGKLTTSFTDFATAQYNALNAPSDEAQAILQSASDELKRVSALDASYLVYIGIGMFVCTYFQMVSWQWTGERNSRRIREKYLAAVLRQDIAYFDNLGAGEVATRIQSDQNLVQAGISEKVAMVVQYTATFVTGFVLAFTQSWRLALALSSILPVIAISGGVMQKFMSKHSTRSLNEVAEGGTIAEEAISSVRTVHAFGMNNILGSLFDQHIAKARASSLRGAMVNAVGLGVMFFAIYAAYALAFVYGGILITQNRADSGIVITVFLSVLIGSFSMAMVNPELEAIGKARGAAAKIFETIERVPLIDSASDEGLKPDTVQGKIEFDRVTFTYPSRPDVPILKQPGLSLTFKAGETNALVGASGSGKSTVAALIMRFYDPTGGRVLLDGRDIRELNVRWLRQNIGLVSQEPTLFGRSVRANIETGLLGSPLENLPADEKLELVKAACIKANAHDFISELPNGYDTDVGERGMLLSGGQKQRVAIARAIISDPKILILDEATSALDGKSEAVVQDALDKASKGRTTVTVAHRLATIRNSDCIFVMGAGAVLEKGSHNDLLENANGPYAQLVAAQALNKEKEAQEEAEADLNQDDSDATPALDEKTPVLRRATTTSSAGASSFAPEEREKMDEKRLSYYYLAKRMLRINHEQKYTYIAGVLGAIASGCVYPALAILFGESIAAFSLPMDQIRSASYKNGLWYFISAILSAIAIVIQNGSLSSTAETLTAKLRSITFRAILRQDIAFFDEEEHATGSLTSNLSDWPQKFNGLAGVTLGAIIQAIATLVFGCIIGLIFGPLLALIGIACIPLLVTAGYIRLRLVVMKDEANRKAHAGSAHLASEAAGAIKTVASLTMEKDCCDVHSKALDPPFRRSIRSAVRNNLLYALSQALAFPVIALVFYVGSRWIAQGKFGVSNYFTVLNSVVFAAIQAGNIFNFVPDMSKAQSSSTSIIRLADQVPDIDCESRDGKVLDDAAVQGHLRMEKVHFRYPSRPAVRVLRGLDLDIPAGWYVALVGPSGCGKSTCIGLLERFYDPLQGRITIDGIPITDLNIASYRSQISLVSQEPTLYAGSVRFNILLGANKPADQISEEELIKACKDANIYDFITSLPDGFDTFCGNKGTQLSGGQKQRIAIARALIRDPKILLLDEATSALDSQSERVVQAAIDNVIHNRNLTVVSIAHRLSTVQNANRIYYFHEGRIAEAGTHQQLIAQRGRYFELTQMQSLSKID